MLSVSLTLWIEASLERRFQPSKHKHSRRMYNKWMSKTNGFSTTMDHQYDNNCLIIFSGYVLLQLEF